MTNVKKNKYRIFISGEWQPEKAEPFKEAAYEIGKLIGEEGYDLTCGPGSGITRYVLEGFKSIPEERRGQVIFYLPKIKEMRRVGETISSTPDVVVKTGVDYPTRNVIQVRDADALIAITGGAGTTTEIINAAMDYDMPVAILDQSGPMVEAVRALPSVCRKVFFGNSAAELVTYIKQQLEKKGKKKKDGSGSKENVLVSG